MVCTHSENRRASASKKEGKSAHSRALPLHAKMPPLIRALADHQAVTWPGRQAGAWRVPNSRRRATVAVAGARPPPPSRRPASVSASASDPADAAATAAASSAPDPADAASAAAPPHPAQQHATFRALATLIAPTAAMHLVGPALGLIDAAVVGRASASASTALAALSPGTVVVDYSCYMATALAVAATNTLALCFARKDGPGAAAALGDALTTAALAGCLLGAFQWFAGPRLAAALLSGSAAASPSGAAAVADAAGLYIKTRAVAAPAALVGFIAQAYFLAARSPGPPLIAALVSGAFNLAGDWGLCIYPFKTGIAGAGGATSLAVVAGTASLLLALQQPLRGAAARAALPSPDFTPGPLTSLFARLPSRASLLSTA